jgi:diacylglycerol kinase (ATP)
MQENRFVQSLNAAVEGFIYVMKTERNMRIHFFIGLFVMLAGIYLNLPLTELMVLFVTIALVLVTEMINTALELVVDMVQTEFHPIARVIKDVAAGAVLLTAINAIIVGYALFSRKLPFNIEDGITRLKMSSWHPTFIALILVLAATIVGKTFLHRGTPLRGGMPSGHSAVAFSIWTIIAFMTNNLVVIVLSFILSFLVARHRIKDNIHNIWEVVVGAVLGILVTTIVFQVIHKL